MHLLEIQPPGGATCISKKFGHQVAPHALSYCLGFPYWIICDLRSTAYFHQSKSFQQAVQLWSSTEVINKGIQLGSSTRIFNQGLQLGSSTRVINQGLQLRSSLGSSTRVSTLTTLTVFTRFQKRDRHRQIDRRPNDRTPCAHGSDKNDSGLDA